MEKFVVLFGDLLGTCWQNTLDYSITCMNINRMHAIHADKSPEYVLFTAERSE